MRRFVFVLVLASVLGSAQERSFVARIEPNGAVPPRELMLKVMNDAGVPVIGFEPLRGTPLYVAIVMEGGKDRSFSRDVAAHYVEWFGKDPNLRGMMVLYAHSGLQSTEMMSDPAKLLQKISTFKPSNPTQDASWQGVLLACRKLGEQEMGKPVRRLVLLIQDPSAYGFLPAANGAFIPRFDPNLMNARTLATLNRNGQLARVIAQLGTIKPIDVEKVFQTGQLYETVIAVEQHLSEPSKSAKDPTPPVISASHIELARQYSAGLVVSGDYSHGPETANKSFAHQAASLSRVLDSLYRVTIRLPPWREGGLEASFGETGIGAAVYPKTLDITPFGPPLAGSERTLIARVEPLMHSPTLQGDDHFATAFEKRGGVLQSIDNLNDAPLYVAIAVEAGDDPIVNNELPARYAKWFMKNPRLRGMMVSYAMDDDSKPKLLVRSASATADTLTRNYTEVLRHIQSFSPSEKTGSFRDVLDHACAQLAAQEHGAPARRILLIITRRSNYGPELSPEELALRVQDAGIVVVVEDHSPHEQWYPPWGEYSGSGQSPPFAYPGFLFPPSGYWPTSAYVFDDYLPWVWRPTPWGTAADKLKRETAALFLKGEYWKDRKTADDFFEAQTRKLAEALDNLYLIRFLPPQTRRPNYELSLHIGDPGAKVHPQAVVLNFDPTCPTNTHILFGRCAVK